MSFGEADRFCDGGRESMPDLRSAFSLLADISSVRHFALLCEAISCCSCRPIVIRVPR